MNKYGLDLEIGGIHYNPFWKTNLFYAILIVILILIIVLIYYKWRVNLKNKRVHDPVEFLVQSLQAQYDKLEKIESQAFYLDLVFKFKEFIRYKYQFDLKHKTDDEVKKFLLQANLNSQMLDQHLITTFADILEASYAVRFAKKVVDQESMRTDLQKAVVLMQQITHKPSEKI